MKIFQSVPSPNFDERPANAEINMLVMHYTGMPGAEAALARLADPASKVSAHYLVDENGIISVMVSEEKRAWHAGVSSWRGVQGINDVSVGIEIVNPGHEFGYRPFPEVQMEAVILLAQEILSRHPIPPRNVVGHSDIAPARKQDPGELFPWDWLAANGVGLWAEIESGAWSQPGESSPQTIQEMQQALAEYGYHVPQDGVFDAVTEAVVVAFQRHFRQEQLDGKWDAECAALLAELLQLAD